MGGVCPEGGSHYWSTSSTPDPETKLYNATCQKCGVTTQFSSAVPNGEGFKHKPNPPKKEQSAAMDKGKSTKKGKQKGTKRGWNFRNPAAMKNKEAEFERRKTEIIEAYLREGSYYKAAKVLKIHRSSLRQLIVRWEKSGAVEEVRRRLMNIESSCACRDSSHIHGEMVSLDKSDERVKATVTFSQKDLVFLRLGRIEMRFVSQEIIEGEGKEPGPV